MLSNLIKFPFWVEKAWANTEMEQPDTVILIDDEDSERGETQASAPAEGAGRRR